MQPRTINYGSGEVQRSLPIISCGPSILPPVCHSARALPDGTEIGNQMFRAKARAIPRVPVLLLKSITYPQLYRWIYRRSRAQAELC